MERHFRPWMGATLLGCVFVCSAFFLVVSIAQAEVPTYEPPADLVTEPDAPEDQPACPAPELEPYEGEDDGAGETRRVRGELAEICAALAARSDRMRERTWWVVAEALEAAEQRQTTQQTLSAILERLEEPVEVQDAAAQQYNDDLVTAVDASGAANKTALYMLIGVVVAFFVGLLLSRTIDRA